jgi:hypothetical protein
MDIIALNSAIVPVAGISLFQNHVHSSNQPQISVQSNPYGSANPYGTITQQNQQPLQNPATTYSAPTYGGSAIPPPIPQSSNPYGTFNAAPTNYNPYGSSRPVVKEDLNVTVVPISAINPYSSKYV